MLYKTIVLELLQGRPEVYKPLRRKRMLLPAIELYAGELKASHEAWKDHLSWAKPDSDESQIASQAMELALKELEGLLPGGSPAVEADQPSLDDFLNYLRDRTPPA